LKLWLDPPREHLRARLAERTRQLFAQGLVEEVEGLLQAGVPETAKPFESIGYRETLDLLAGKIDRGKAIELTFYATCQYAKRQRSWFRRESGFAALPGFGHEIPIMQQAEEMVRAHLDKFG
jgi:tRNA dimethylallyltransferase